MRFIGVIRDDYDPPDPDVLLYEHNGGIRDHEGREVSYSLLDGFIKWDRSLVMEDLVDEPRFIPASYCYERIAGDI